MQDIPQLKARIKTYILSQGQVLMSDLFNLGKRRYQKHEMHAAIALLNKDKDIAKKVKGTDVLYSKKLPPKPRAKPMLAPIRYTEEDRRQARDFWEHSPLVTDEERACYYEGFKSQACKELLWTPAERRYQENKKHGPAAKRIREQQVLHGV